jgi:hypothetical protein
MIHTFAGIPSLWRAKRQETVPEEQRRRMRLADKIRELAKSINLDRDMHRLKLRDVLRGLENGDESSGDTNPTVAALLPHVANLWDSAGWEPQRAFPNSGLWRRERLHVFTFRYVFAHAASLVQGRPMTITALIVSALLDRDIGANEFAHDRVLDEMSPRKPYQK